MSEKHARVRERLWILTAMLGAAVAGGVVASIVTAGVAVRAQGAGEVLTASQVNLVDGTGRLRGTLAGSDESGRASLSFLDGTGRVRATFGVQADGTPLMQLHGSGGETRLLATLQGDDAVLVVGPEGAPQGLFGAIRGAAMLTLGDGQRSRMQLLLTREGLPRAVLADATGQEAVALSVASNDMPRVALSVAGRPRAAVSATPDATALNLGDATATRLVAGVAEDGAPSVLFLDAAGEFMASLGEIETGRVGFIDADGQIIEFSPAR